jgi:hypothetical protein
MIVELEPKEAEERLKLSLNPIVGSRLKIPLELGIESKLEGALGPMVGSRPLVRNERD